MAVYTQDGIAMSQTNSPKETSLDQAPELVNVTVCFECDEDVENPRSKVICQTVAGETEYVLSHDA